MIHIYMIYNANLHLCKPNYFFSITIKIDTLTFKIVLTVKTNTGQLLIYLKIDHQ